MVPKSYYSWALRAVTVRYFHTRERVAGIIIIPGTCWRHQLGSPNLNDKDELRHPYYSWEILILELDFEHWGEKMQFIIWR